MGENEVNDPTRQERREQKLKKKKERVVVHGKSIAQIYRNAISKRLKK